MLELRGAPALSAFRHERLLTVLRDRVPEVEALSAHYVHFIDHHEELDHAAEARLAKLLEYGSRDSQEIPDNAQRFLVVPRLGTQSPWSSKATDIAHNCGLSQISRIERGIDYRVELRGAPSTEQLEAISALLHDRMTHEWI